MGWWCALHDSDGDGWDDVEEMIKGTDPYNPDTDGDSFIDSEDPFPLDPALPVQPTIIPSPVAPSATPIMTPAPVSTPTPEEPGFEGLMWLLAVVFVVLIGYVNTIKRRK